MPRPIILAADAVDVARSSIYGWVQRFAPLYMEAARRKRHPVECRCSIDEMYVKVAGVWRYVYRAIDEDGQVVDVLRCERRDTEAAVAFFEQAFETTGVRPTLVTTDKAAAYPPALAQVLPEAAHPNSTRPRGSEGHSIGHQMGGRPVQSNGSAAGVSTTTAVQTVVVDAHHAAILLNAGPTSALAA